MARRFSSRPSVLQSSWPGRFLRRTGREDEVRDEIDAVERGAEPGNEIPPSERQAAGRARTAVRGEHDLEHIGSILGRVLADLLASWEYVDGSTPSAELEDRE
jgi:hypothetical protein